MTNWVIMPLLIPLLTGVLLIFFHRRNGIQRAISAVSVLAGLGASLYLTSRVSEHGIQTLHMSGWAPPFGIVFVADMFAALLVLTAAIIGAACLFYAFRTIGEERENHYFYPFFQFLLVGVQGSFMTGDIFNLFVCFEVMLISSYALIVHGGGKTQLRESIKYILVNIVSSVLFVASVAYLYAVVGTLNMAHLSVRVAEAGQGGMLNVVAVFFLIVFSLKGGLFLFFWLPGSYSAPHSAVIALFAGLLTKVGLYAIIRTFTLIFYHDPAVTHTLIGWMAAATMILGVLGAVAFQDVNRILIYNIVAAVGFIAFGLAVANKSALDGAVFYLIHDMIVKSLLFFLGGALIAYAGTEKLQRMGGVIRSQPVLGWMFLAAAMALVGVPPLSGFIGKLLIVQGGLQGGYYWLTGIGLGSSLLILYSVMKIFLNGFLGEAKGERNPVPMRGMLAPSAFLLAIAVLLGVGAEWVLPYVMQAGEVLQQPQLYIDAVLKEQ